MNCGKDEMNKKWYLLIGLSLATITVDGTKDSRLEELRRRPILFGVDISARELEEQLKRKTEKGSSPGPHPARRIRVWRSSDEESKKDDEEGKE